MSKITVIDLLEKTHPIELWDKVFWYADELNINDKTLDIYVSNGNVTGFNERYKPDIKKLSNSKTNKEKGVLVSSGSFLFVNNMLALTQRTKDTLYDPGKWTSPAGRCDLSPLNTAYAETVEEIAICDEKNRLHILSECKPFLPLWARNKEIVLHDQVTCDRSLVFTNLLEVNFILDNKLIENSVFWYMYNESCNTLELRKIINIKISEKIFLMNPEFNTKTILVSIDRAREIDTVPALGYFIKSIA